MGYLNNNTNWTRGSRDKQISSTLEKRKKVKVRMQKASRKANRG